MSVLFRNVEQRASFQQVFSTGGDISGIKANSIQAALRLVPVYAATSLIADSLAACPLAIFEKTDGVPRQVDGVQLVENPGVGGLDVYSWKFQGFASDLLQGNAYGHIEDVDRRGIPSKVRWFRPDQVTIDDQTGELYWNGRLIPALDVMHIPAYVVPGSKKGLSPIGLFRTQFETGLEAQRFGRSFFRRNAIPSGFLKNTQKTLDPAQASTVKERFVASVSSAEPFVAGADWDYTTISVPQGDAQFLAGIKATANQVAAAYRVEPGDVGGEAGGSTLKYASLEMDQLKFQVRTMRPWAARFEAVIDRYLPTGQYARFNLDSAARADLKTRYEAHALAISNGFKAPDEVRLLEELGPLTPEQMAQITAMRKQQGATHA